VSSWTVVAVMQLALAGGNGETYAEARRATDESGRPMVVMVGATWCGPCQQMKKQVIPKVRERGLFKEVSFATVDADAEAEIAREIIGSGPVPQLVMYRKTQRGWLRRRLVGKQSVEAVEHFIKQGLADDEKERADDHQVESKPDSDTERSPT